MPSHRNAPAMPERHCSLKQVGFVAIMPSRSRSSRPLGLPTFSPVFTLQLGHLDPSLEADKRIAERRAVTGGEIGEFKLHLRAVRLYQDQADAILPREVLERLHDLFEEQHVLLLIVGT